MPFADGDDPVVGTEVNFVHGFDSRSGKERAQDIRLGKDSGYSGQPRWYGYLAEWKNEKACGFIQCEEPPGKRLFAHKSDFSFSFEDNDPPVEGMKLSFVHGRDAKSCKERAVDIAKDDGTRVRPTGNVGASFGSDMAQLRLFGTLQEWKDEKACGFIVCENPPGKRLFAHKTDFTTQFAERGGPLLGMRLAFVLGRDARSGKERAQSIQVAD